MEREGRPVTPGIARLAGRHVRTAKVHRFQNRAEADGACRGAVRRDGVPVPVASCCPRDSSRRPAGRLELHRLLRRAAEPDVFFAHCGSASKSPRLSAVIGYAAAFAIVNACARRARAAGRPGGAAADDLAGGADLCLDRHPRPHRHRQRSADRAGPDRRADPLLFSETAIFIGLLQLFLPLMILPLISALENMPKDAVPAARVLGANWLQVFWKVMLPLTREGLVVGGTLVFVGIADRLYHAGDPRRLQGADAGDAAVPARHGRQRLSFRPASSPSS
jgi:hypothetical protein